MSSARLELDGVWKSYPRWSAGPRTIRGALGRRIPLLRRGDERLWAVKDVSLRLGAGESMGVVGRNGSGKSTLLRLASGLGRPTRGTIDARGSVASVLSLGRWFDHELTGRENAVTALMINGWRAAEARRLLPAVLEFAELEEFAEAPVRTYSDGMRLRLAFGVVAQLHPDVLVIDEVIAVGDLGFQEKCLHQIRRLREGGTALLLASHGLEQVAAECDQAIWLDAGAARAAGEAQTVVAEYREAMHRATLERTPPAGGGESRLVLGQNRLGSQEITIESVTLRGPDGTPTAQLASGAALTVSMRLVNHGPPVHGVVVDVAIYRLGDGTLCYDTSTQGDGVSVGTLEGEATVELHFERLELIPGEYALDTAAYPADWAYAYDFHHKAYPLRVVGREGDTGVYRPPHRWRISP